MPVDNEDMPSLEALQRKIDQAKPATPDDDARPRDSDYAQAFRFTVELSAGVLVGALIGYGTDIWLGTLPWAMIGCLFLGMAAGIRNMMRSAREIESTKSE